MNALVFAAGRGTRLRPHTDETPKPLLEIDGKPLLERCVRPVVDAGVERIVVVVGYRAAEIETTLGDSIDGVPVTYVTQRKREGLAHAVLTAADRLEDGDLLTVNGDNVFSCSLSPLLERHRESGVDGTVALDRVSRNEAETMALCELTADGRIRTLESTPGDRPEAGYIAAGVQTHDASALVSACRRIERGDSGEYELADALQVLVDEGARYAGVELEGWHLNVNTPADLEAARRFVREGEP